MGFQDDTLELGAREERPGIAQVFDALAARRESSAPLFPLTLSHARRTLAEAASTAGLEPFVPHQLRHGGASHDGFLGIEAAELMRIGRWSSLSSVARYRKPGRYLRALTTLTQVQKRKADETELTVSFRLAQLLKSLSL